jgi:hypothetical protein
MAKLRFASGKSKFAIQFRAGFAPVGPRQVENPLLNLALLLIKSEGAASMR